ncbi:MAG: type II toxin-antitoxin system Phd/YefM family antitoxin [Candidatus Promineofilum sp.]|nr:type II toxin-antitoxin system Phd/YefM family antitoxin [Promineifilum sp.]
MQFTVHEAKTNLSKLIRLALAGEEVIIARGDVPVVKLTPVVEEKPHRQLGIAEGFVIYMADDFDNELEEFADYME